MSFEVEQKFAVADLAALEQRLVTLGARPDQDIVQVDLYFAHPARDFAQTDEALRIRRVGERNYVTYKGAKIDSTTKTRREIELDLAPGDKGAREFQELLELLGFRPVAEVRKHRRTWLLSWQEHEVEAALDDVDRVGTFAELEIAADQAGVDAARDSLASLASHLNLSNGERRSYLELLLENTAAGRPQA
jgi:adenylate cyclase, class 2